MTGEAGLPDYQQLSDLLESAGLGVTAAEAHGLLSGVLVLPDADKVDWLDLLLSTEDQVTENLSTDLSQFLLDLFRATRHQLSSREFGYRVYLPNQEQGLQQQALAIAAWCRGFLLGVSATGLTAENCGDVVREILSDIVELSSVESEGDDPAGEEHALLEIEEYLRVAVQLLKEELQAVNG